MSKYIVTWTTTERKLDSWDDRSYHNVDRQKHLVFPDDVAMANFVKQIDSNMKNVRYFAITKEIFPKL